MSTRGCAGEKGAAWCFGSGRMIQRFRPTSPSIKRQALFSSKSAVSVCKHLLEYWTVAGNSKGKHQECNAQRSSRAADLIFGRSHPYAQHCERTKALTYAVNA